MMMKPLLDHYQEEILKNMIAPYQYVLNVPEEPDEDEKYTVMMRKLRCIPEQYSRNMKSRNAANRSCFLCRWMAAVQNVESRKLLQWQDVSVR